METEIIHGDSLVLENNTYSGLFEHGNEQWVPIKAWRFRKQLTDCQLFKDSA